MQREIQFSHERWVKIQELEAELRAAREEIDRLTKENAALAAKLRAWIDLFPLRRTKGR